MQGVVLEGTPRREPEKQERVKTGSARPALFLFFFFTIRPPLKAEFTVLFSFFPHICVDCKQGTALSLH